MILAASDPQRAGPSRLRPRHEVADIFRQAGPEYRQQHRLPVTHHKAMRAIETCRTAKLGGHLERCDRCHYERPAYNSCRNRHCPKCQAMAKAEWLERRRAELLPVPYFHAVFTLPHELNATARHHPALIYGLLFRYAAATLQQLASDPRHGLMGRLAITAVLHTWDQELRQHVHVHCLIPAGVLAFDGSRWTHARRHFLFPVRVMSSLFRGKFLHALREVATRTPGLHADPRFSNIGELCSALRRKDWVVYCQPPFDGPSRTLDYLGRYTHRVAIANHRIAAIEDGAVSIRCRDRKRRRQRTVRLPIQEFIRRFMLHVLPSGFVRIRHFGILANCAKAQALARCRALLAAPPPVTTGAPMTADERMTALTGVDAKRCPCCHRGRMTWVSELPPLRAAHQARASPTLAQVVTS
jgi:hypothetical protein